jgi:hypothetical protein
MEKKKKKKKKKGGVPWLITAVFFKASPAKSLPCRCASRKGEGKRDY